MIGEMTREDKDIFIENITKLVNDDRIICFEVDSKIINKTGPEDRHKVFAMDSSTLTITYR